MGHSWYELIHDFSGPVATFVAAIAAFYVTWRFGSRQLNIAKRQQDTIQQQADIALDRLAYDLFERRYNVYAATTDLISYVVKEVQVGLDPRKLAPLYLAIEEAQFFFPMQFYAFLRTDVIEACQQLIQVAAKRGPDPADPQWNALTDQFWSISSRLADLLREMPTRFARELQFQQLARRQHGT